MKKEKLETFVDNNERIQIKGGKFRPHPIVKIRIKNDAKNMIELASSINQSSAAKLTSFSQLSETQKVKTVYNRLCHVATYASRSDFESFNAFKEKHYVKFLEYRNSQVAAIQTIVVAYNTLIGGNTYSPYVYHKELNPTGFIKPKQFQVSESFYTSLMESYLTGVSIVVKNSISNMEIELAKAVKAYQKEKERIKGIIA